jgi:hypothetical protein
VTPAKLGHAHAHDFFQGVIDPASIKGFGPGIVEDSQRFGFAREYAEQRGVGGTALFREAKGLANIRRNICLVNWSDSWRHAASPQQPHFNLCFSLIEKDM